MPSKSKYPPSRTKGLIQNQMKEVQEKHGDAISKAIHDTMMFAGDFVFDPKNPDKISSITRVTSLEETAERLNWFFKTCEETQQLPTVEKMYLALGMNRSRYSDWVRNDTNPDIVKMIEKGKALISAMDAQLATTGTLQPVVYIFRAKNYYGMRDQVDIQASTVDPTETNHKLLEDKYKDIVDITPNETQKKD